MYGVVRFAVTMPRFSFSVSSTAKAPGSSVPKAPPWVSRQVVVLTRGVLQM